MLLVTPIFAKFLIATQFLITTHLLIAAQLLIAPQLELWLEIDCIASLLYGPVYSVNQLAFLVLKILYVLVKLFLHVVLTDIEGIFLSLLY